MALLAATVHENDAPEPVGGEFQPPFETAYPGGGAHLFSVLHSIFVINRITTTAIGNFRQ
jgi:hypothetical protein